MCEGDEHSQRTAGSASRAACTWCVKQELRGCTRSGLRERDRVYCGEAQPAARAEQTKSGLGRENRVKKKNKCVFSTFYCIHADHVPGNWHWIDGAGSNSWGEHCRGISCAQDSIRISGWGEWKGVVLLRGSSAVSWDRSCPKTTVSPNRRILSAKKILT